MKVVPFLYTLNFGPVKKEEDDGYMKVLIIFDLNLSFSILPQKIKLKFYFF